MTPTMPAAEIAAYALPGDVRIERTPRRDGPDWWAVRWLGDCLNHAGEWECEPSPSARTEEFLARCRYGTAELAYATWEKARPLA